MAIPRNLSDLANQVDSSGTLGIAGGGTGLTTVGTNGQVLSSDGTNAVWATPAPGAGTLQAIASGSLSDGSTVIINPDGTVSVVTGTTFSSNATVFESALTSVISATYDATNQKVVIAYQDGGNSFYGTAIVGTVSGTSISFGTAVVFESADTSSISATYDSTNQKVVIAYRDSGNSNYGTAIVGTVSGTSISFGTAVVFESASTSNISSTYDSTNQKVVIAYQDGGNSSFGTAIVGTVSGSSITFGTAVVFESANTNFISATYDSTNQKVVIAYIDNGNSSFGTASVVTFPFTDLTAENYIGISNGVYSNGQTATIQIVGSVDDAQSGLTAGQSYYVTNDGTLSTTPANPSVFAGTAVSATKLIVKG